EKIGTYNPLTVPASIILDDNKAFDWLMKGAQPSDTVRAMLSYRGVMLRRHLQLGVAKGAITQEQADSKLTEWVKSKQDKIQSKVEGLAKAKQTAAKARKEAESKVKEARAEAIRKKAEVVVAPAETPAEETPAEPQA
ncbi:MAG TPA: 30S ribosomal protein S16, partial [Cyclobacteriaceae bacterium]|nr:30S ribosomal protein S16 [Cyclobacteriaceae bacterium]